MTPEMFDWLLEKVRPYISKQDTHLRKSISASERLSITLRHLATGKHFYKIYYIKLRSAIVQLRHFYPPVQTVLAIIFVFCIKIRHLFDFILQVKKKIPKFTVSSGSKYHIWHHKGDLQSHSSCIKRRVLKVSNFPSGVEKCGRRVW